MVLVVDDDPVVRLLFQELMPAFGYEVITYASGAEGLAACLQQDLHPAALFIDYMLPDMTGPELISKIRRQTNHAIPVVLMSAHEDTTRLLAGAPAQPDEILPKPFTVPQLRELLERACC